jgi:hypothetical protein
VQQAAEDRLADEGDPALQDPVGLSAEWLQVFLEDLPHPVGVRDDLELWEVQISV